MKTYQKNKKSGSILLVVMIIGLGLVATIGSFIGLSVHSMEIMTGDYNLEIAQPISEINNFPNYTIGRKNKEISLIPREEECLFYFLRGKTIKVVAAILGLSIRDTENILEGLKKKFNCSTQPDLIGKAI